MNNAQTNHPDAARSALRTMVAAVDRELSLLQKGTTTGGAEPASGLTTAWAALVKQLDLGPEPDLRECPVCMRVGMRAATVCGFCWTKLTPPETNDPARSA